MAKELINYIPQEVKERIATLQGQKETELKALQSEIDKAIAAKNKADEDLKAAMEVTNLDAYTKAKKEQLEAKTAKEMYESRLKQLQEKEFVTEEESDKVIASLLAFEKELTEEYEGKAKTLINDLRKINRAYLVSVRDAEETIKAWTSNIHENYLSSGTTYADGSNRSQTPVPVHRLPYKGCDASRKVTEFLESMKV